MKFMFLILFLSQAALASSPPVCADLFESRFIGRSQSEVLHDLRRIMLRGQDASESAHPDRIDNANEDRERLPRFVWRGRNAVTHVYEPRFEAAIVRKTHPRDEPFKNAEDYVLELNRTGSSEKLKLEFKERTKSITFERTQAHQSRFETTFIQSIMDVGFVAWTMRAILLQHRTEDGTWTTKWVRVYVYQTVFKTEAEARAHENRYVSWAY